MLRLSSLASHLLLLGALLSACGDDDESCTTGDTRACTCPEGTASAQVCGDDGTFGPCLACTTDGGVADGGPLRDGSLEMPCVYPSDERVPTSGSCEGGRALTCTPEGRMVATECDSSERCVLVDVTYDDHAFVWAACVPTDAEACDLSDLSTCTDASTVRYCAPPVPPLLDTDSGFFLDVTCHPDDACVEGRCVLQGETCDAEGDTRCAGEDRLICIEGRWSRDDCAWMGDAVCASGAACGVGASCVPRSAVESPESLCTPLPEMNGTTSGCTDEGEEIICRSAASVCFGEDVCRCIPIVRACLPGNVCDLGDRGLPQCVADVSCAEGSRCNGADVIVCPAEGPRRSFACDAHGMVCEGGATPGCSAGGACDPSSVQSCNAEGQVSGCCPSSGTFEGTGTGHSFPCVPGEEVRFNCPSPMAGSYRCEEAIGCVYES